MPASRTIFSAQLIETPQDADALDLLFGFVKSCVE